MSDASGQSVVSPSGSGNVNGGPLPTRPDGVPPRPPRGLRNLGRALRSRNYRLFFLGQGISVAGTWMQGAALAWLVYRLTGSATMLGVVGFCGHICTFLIAPFAGTLADRWDRRRLAMATQTLAMLQAFALAALTMSGVVQVWHILALAMVLGTVAAFDIPVRQALAVDMVESRDDLSNAIALNSFLVNGGKFVGPSVAGVLITHYGEGVCFAVNGVTYLAVIAALGAMRLAPRVVAHKDHVLRALGEGLRYAAGAPPLRSILLLLATVSLVGFSYNTLMPVFAKTILQGGPRTHGLLLSSAGVGALLGAVYLASRRSVPGLERIVALSPALLGVSLGAFALSRSLPLSMGVLTLAGFASMTQIAGSNTLLQTLVRDSHRGRVMSFYTMCFMGMGPFGSLLIGGLAGSLGASQAVAISAACSLVATVVFATRLPMLSRQVRDACAESALPAAPARS